MFRSFRHNNAFSLWFGKRFFKHLNEMNPDLRFLTIIMH
jgi:hypothetical protein